jgi:fructoselysine-6-P-deglycase FrlB-like protein
VNTDGFVADILAEPDALRAVADAYDGAGLERLLDRPRSLLIGMGSSRYAADTAVAALRGGGRDAYAELASTGTPQPPASDTTAVVISASGTSDETLEAMRRHRGTSRVVALTNAPDSPLAREADEAVDVMAGPEAGGIACRSFACTQAVLALMGGAPADEIRSAADAVSALIESRGAWLEPLVEAAEAGRGVWVAGPAERFGSAQQSALMLREAPRIVADACETGDWLHVDVYLTKRPGYVLLLLAGSRYDAEVAGWRRDRDFRLVTVGGVVEGADTGILFPGAGRRAVAAIAETAVAELLAAELWRRSPI